MSDGCSLDVYGADEIAMAIVGNSDKTALFELNAWIIFDLVERVLQCENNSIKHGGIDHLLIWKLEYIEALTPAGM